MGLRITIGGPFFNEEDGIVVFLERTERALRELRARDPSLTFSLVLVNDGSSDKSAEKVGSYFSAGSGPTNSVFAQVRVVTLSRNFGHSAATGALIDLLGPEEDALIMMDTDLQDPPELISQLVEFYRQKHQCVRVVRGKRPEGQLFEVFSWAFYRLFAKLTSLPTGMGTFGLYDRKVVEALRAFPEKHRYLPGLFSLAGFSTYYLHHDRHPRHAGKSKVGARGLASLATMALFSFSTIPIHLMALAGLLIASLSLLGTFVVIGIKIFTTKAIPGWASLLGAQFFIGGCLLLGMGVLGEYIGVIFKEVKNRPTYIVFETKDLLASSQLSPPLTTDQNSLQFAVK